ncbi:Gfo/Idh/MocA family protein [Paenibacillus senegalensis]|uniref:Gfo/Idh/MocA family protein n=1 Tax=Paenibacillus senegalensis TaxID=1465766 RepID=UPI0002898397|nr:Gfo/Idh/MocA family oxidoreductase [Paenibacillus senegalensis]
MRTYRAALIGIGGFGEHHVKIIEELVREGSFKLTAFTEIRPEAFPATVSLLTRIGAVPYTDYEHMLAEQKDTDFVIIATPISTHKTIATRVMSMGYHVIVEKPPAVTIQDIDEMIQVQKQTGKKCQVNFQNTSLRSFRQMLSLLEQGAIGEVTQITGVGRWRRTKAYYARTPWAGKLTYNGQYVLDGTFTNPLAHLLNNCLQAAGAISPELMIPQSVQAELYHVNDIEGDDVSCIRAEMPGQLKVNFYAMLCHTDNARPFIQVQGSEGSMRWSYDNSLIVRTAKGEEKFQYEEENRVRNMYLNLMQAIEDEHVPLYSSIEACRSYVLVSNGVYESARGVVAIDSQYVQEIEAEGSTARLLPALSEQMHDIADRGVLYSEVPFPWARKTRRVDMRGYNHFAVTFAGVKS